MHNCYFQFSDDLTFEHDLSDNDCQNIDNSDESFSLEEHFANDDYEDPDYALSETDSSSDESGKHKSLNYKKTKAKDIKKSQPFKTFKNNHSDSDTVSTSNTINVLPSEQEYDISETTENIFGVREKGKVMKGCK